MSNQSFDRLRSSRRAVIAQPCTIVRVGSMRRPAVTRRDILSYGAAVATVGFTGSLLTPRVAHAGFMWFWRLLMTFGRAAFRAAGAVARSIVRVSPPARSTGVGAMLAEAANGFMTIYDLVTLADLADSLLGVRPQVHASIKQHGSQALWFRGEYNRYQLSFLNDSGEFVKGRLMFEVEDLDTFATVRMQGPLITLQPGANGVVPHIVRGEAGEYLPFPLLTSTGPKLIKPYIEHREFVLFQPIGPVQVVDRSDVQMVPGTSG